jgi:peptide deformylase
MAIREILTTPDPFLRERARKVRSVTSEVKSLIDDMIETMRSAPGVGLAAPQIGVGLRVIVAEYGEPSEDAEAEPIPAKLHAIVNPEIVRHSNETNLDNEGCLSIPGYMGEVERYDVITVKGLNRHGKPLKIKTNGWMARIIQHEIDHLEGVLFIDRATQVWKMEEVDETQPLPEATSTALD